MLVWNPNLVFGKPPMVKLMVARMPWPDLPQSASNVQGKGRHGRVDIFEPSVCTDLSYFLFNKVFSNSKRATMTLTMVTVSSVSLFVSTP